MSTSTRHRDIRSVCSMFRTKAWRRQRPAWLCGSMSQEASDMRPAMTRRTVIASGIAFGLALVGNMPEASADGPVPNAEVMIIHATKCDKRTVDPEIGTAPPSLGFECLKLLGKKTMPLVLN